MTAHPLPAWLARRLGIDSGPGEGRDLEPGRSVDVAALDHALWR